MWVFALQNLAYLLPFYTARVLCPNAADDDCVQIDDQDIEFQGCIAQLFSLMSTVADRSPQKQQLFSENIEAVLYTMVGYCLLGDETERLFSEDKNAFLTAFLDDSAEMMSSISIRMSVIDLLEECFFKESSFDRLQLQQVLQAFFFDTVPQEFYS